MNKQLKLRECFYIVFNKCVSFLCFITLDVERNSVTIMLMTVKIGFTLGRSDVGENISNGGVQIGNLELTLAS